MASRVPDEEVPILDALVAIRNRMLAIKKDRWNSIKADDVSELNAEIAEQIERLQQTREASGTTEAKSRVDDVLNDVFHLLSLFHLSIGKTKKAAATYANLATMKQCLDHLNETGAYTKHELEYFEKRLEELSGIIKAEEAKEDASLATFRLLKTKLQECKILLEQLMNEFNNVHSSLQPVHDRLVDIGRELNAIRTRGSFDDSEIVPFQKELRAIDNQRVDGRFLAPDGSTPPGQAQVIGLLEECFENVHDMFVSRTQIADSLRPLYERLMTLKNDISNLALTHRWTARETELWMYQVQLTEIGSMRKDGKFYDEEGNVPEGQEVLPYLLHKCYGIVYKILASSQPVAEPLIPTHNQLTTLRQLLVNVKKIGGPYTPQELYPYQMKLASIDNLRVDGKFLDENGFVPESQGMLMALLNECYDILYEMQAELTDD